MDKALIVAVVIVLLFALFGGMEGILWCHVFAVPLGHRPGHHCQGDGLVRLARPARQPFSFTVWFSGDN